MFETTEVRIIHPTLKQIIQTKEVWQNRAYMIRCVMSLYIWIKTVHSYYTL